MNRVSVEDFIWACREAERYFQMEAIQEIHIVTSINTARVSVIDGCGDEIVLTQ